MNKYLDGTGLKKGPETTWQLAGSKEGYKVDPNYTSTGIRHLNEALRERNHPWLIDKHTKELYPGLEDYLDK